ncbi:MAG: hypothetical protein OEU92_29040, partial [Alphaproteobacteria bacterium]|nr:hypothetical protein [Alphaproteobacteria bacterium]
MNGGPTWKSADLDDPDARANAIAFAESVMERSGERHLRHDLTWALIGRRTDDLLALRLDGEGVAGFGLLVRQ